MRSVWAIVVACLVVGAGMRPVAPAPLGHDHGTKLTRARGALPVLARRDRDRACDRRPELTLPAGVVPAPLAPTAPRVGFVQVLPAAHVVSIFAVRTPRSSRGPPHA